MRQVNAYAAFESKGELKPFQYQLPELSLEQVDIRVLYCGICHSDLSMVNNEWRNSQFPLVPGHEIVGEVVAVGSEVKNLQVGNKVGLGWFSASCMHCHTCMDGDHHLCGSAEQTIVGRHGGFADYVRAHWSWAIPLPEGIDLAKAGPLLCGGITVFHPIIASEVSPVDKVGVIGIGGLGHLAIKFLKHWGCEVVAFTTSADKNEQIKAMGAHQVINTKDPKSLAAVKGLLKFILNTTNVNLDWRLYLNCLTPKGKLHHVGAVLEPMPIQAMTLVGGEKSIGGSPLGSPATTQTMLEFCMRHQIYPTVEEFPLAKVNEALAHLEAGKARYRIVLRIAD